MPSAFETTLSEQYRVSVADQWLLVSKGYPQERAQRFLDTLAPLNTGFRKQILCYASLRGLAGPAAPSAVLSKPIAEKIARLERLWAKVCDVYKGDVPAARQFLFTRHLMLEDKAPIDFALAGETSSAYLNSVLDTIDLGFAV